MLAFNYHWDLYHMDRRVKPMMKRETYLKDITWHMQPDYGYLPYIGARLQKTWLPS